MSLLLKMIGAFVAAIVLIIVMGVYGLTFHLWPTWPGDKALAISPQAMQALSQLRAEPKFVMDKSNFYFGAPNEDVRIPAQGSVDRLLDSLLLELPKNPRRSAVLAQFKQAMAAFPISESEERDQFLAYLQRIMRILDIKGSGELLNVWRYGFPYGWWL